MLKIRINGAPANFYACLQAEDEWIARCTDGVVGEFHVSFADELHLQLENGYWLPVTQGELMELAVQEAATKRKNA